MTIFFVPTSVDEYNAIGNSVFDRQYFLRTDDSIAATTARGIYHFSTHTSELSLTVLGDILSEEDSIDFSRSGDTRVTIGRNAEVFSTEDRGVFVQTRADIDFNNAGYVHAAANGVVLQGTPPASSFNYQDVLNTGTIISDTGVGLSMLNSDRISFSNSGHIVGESGGVVVEADLQSDFSNSGTIEGERDAGLRFSVEGGVPTSGVNSGLIQGATGVVLGIQSPSSTLNFLNTGEIFGHGLWTNRGGIFLEEGSLYSITNTGTVGGTAGIAASWARSDAGSNISVIEVYNTGEIYSIRGDEGLGVGFGTYFPLRDCDPGETSCEPEDVDDTESARLELTNAGHIQGYIRGGDIRDEVVNSGSINGDVLLNWGNDLYDGVGGTVTGQVFGGRGDDVYRVDTTTTQLVEFEDEGTDRVESTISYALGDHIENLTLIEVANIDGTGNILENRIVGNSGQNILSGSSGDDRLLARGGADRVEGGSEDDYISGNAGWDSLFGGTGDDTILGGSGRDLIDGGEGVDRASYFNALLTGVRADLDNSTLNQGIARGDTYVDIENLYGSRFADRLYGDVENNEIVGDRGDDILWGRDGDDVIDGMHDDDRISGNMGDDTLRGGLGNDTFNFWVNNGNDTISDYTDGSDQIRFFIGGLGFGSLSISNSGGNAVIDYGTGDITLIGVSAAVLDAGDFVF